SSADGAPSRPSLRGAARGHAGGARSRAPGGERASHASDRREPGVYAAAARRNWRTVVSGVRLARPWLMPLRVSRLTLAAPSAIVLLSTSAELWDLAAVHRLDVLSAVALAALASASAYVIRRQRLFLGRTDRVTTVITHATATGIVTSGMTSTLTLLLGLSLLVSTIVFPPEVVGAWITSASGPVGLWVHARLAAIVASVGL